MCNFFSHLRFISFHYYYYYLRSQFIHLQPKNLFVSQIINYWATFVSQLFKNNTKLQKTLKTKKRRVDGSLAKTLYTGES